MQLNLLWSYVLTNPSEVEYIVDGKFIEYPNLQNIGLSNTAHCRVRVFSPLDYG
jgi:hypothetical protein